MRARMDAIIGEQEKTSAGVFLPGSQQTHANQQQNTKLRESCVHNPHSPIKAPFSLLGDSDSCHENFRPGLKWSSFYLYIIIKKKNPGIEINITIPASYHQANGGAQFAPKTKASLANFSRII